MSGADIPVTSELCEAFVSTMDALAHRRAGTIPEDVIERLIALRWLDWRGGHLQLTAVGEHILMKIQVMTDAAFDSTPNLQPPSAVSKAPTHSLLPLAARPGDSQLALGESKVPRFLRT